MRVAVTGAGGHLGGTLVRTLLDEGHDVRAIDLERTDALEGLDVPFEHGDVTDLDRMTEVLTDCDAVCHLAARISVAGDPTGIVRRVNVDGPAIVADAALAAGASRLVHCRSVHAYDLARARGVVDESSERSVSPDVPAYDRSKWAGERSVYERIHSGLQVVVVNPTGIIGPYDFAPSRMGQVFLAIRDGRLPFTVEGGFDWVDVRDVAHGIVSALRSGTVGRNYLLSGTFATMPDLMATAAEIAGAAPPKVTVPSVVASAWGPVGAMIARNTNSALSVTSESLYALFNGTPVSSVRAEADLGYRTRPLRDSIDDIYAWFGDR